MARLLLDGGADVNASTLGPNGGDTMGLLVTSKQASDAECRRPPHRCSTGVWRRLDLTSDDCLDGSLANHAPRAAEKISRSGRTRMCSPPRRSVRWTYCVHSSTTMAACCPARVGEREMSARDAVGLALLYAYVREQRDAVDFLLEKDGNWNMVGVNNGAALHRAAFSGNLDMVQRLVETRRRPEQPRQPVQLDATTDGPTTTTSLKS